MKKSLRTVSVMMALLLGIQLLPMDILANAVSTQTETAIEVQNPITGECKELRDEYTKVYRREDGSQIAVIAPEAIHYIKDGKFADIDNTLIESSKSGHKVLTNKDNPFSIELPVTLNKDEKIKVTGDGYTLSFQFRENLNSSSAHITKQQNEEVKEPKNAAEQAVEKAELYKSTSAVTYSNILDNVDAQYVIDNPDSTTTVTPFFEGTAENPAYAGDNCYKVNKTGTGEEFAEKTVTGVPVSKFYTVSCWVKTVGETAAVQLIIGGGGLSVGSSQEVKTQGKWQYIQASVITSDDSQNAAAIIEILFKNSGDFYIDNIQLEQANPATSYNFLENSTLSDGGNHWSTASYISAASYAGDSTGTPAKLDTNRLSITASMYVKRFASQRVSVNGKEGDTYTFGGWACAAGTLPVNELYDRELSISAVIPSDVTGGDEEVLGTIEYNTYVTNWQYQESSFTLDADCSAVEIRLNYNYQSGTAYFDGMELTKEALYISLDSEGNIVTGEESTEETPETTEWSKGDVSYGIEKDAYGNTVKSYTANGMTAIEQTNTYTANGNYAASSTDELGHTAEYTYNEQLGLLTSLEDAKNSVIDFVYNAAQQTTSVSQTVSNSYYGVNSLSFTNSYTYNDSDGISTISNNNGTQYAFTYDKWGNPLTVSVGATALATYEYTADAQRDLSTITYANGNSFVITKDVFGVGINADLYCFLDENEDTSSGWYAFYDDFGAPYMLLLDDANGRYILFRDGLTEECMPGEEILDPPVVLHSYAANEIADGTQLLEKIGSTTVKSTYLNDTQGNASLAQFSIVGSTSDPVNQENRWDEYGRLAETGVYSGEIGDTRENAAVVTGYGYTGVPGAKTSSQVASVSISGGEGAGAFCSSYEYWYDAVGNISDIYKDNALSAHYEYDEAGQLIRADDAQQNQSFTYNYDAGGNLLTKKEYSFTTGTLGTATDTIQYTYGDSSWADKLTSFDGNAVSYDASGNPTAYDGWTYTWEGSGRLTGMNKTGIGSIAFTYNQDGIRTGKTFGSVTTEYTVVDSKITHMQTGSDDLYFFYDENDSLVSLNVDRDDNFYVKNLQGDIIALTDIDGNIVVEYLYDAWGRLLSTTGSMASTLGVDNPFRYRGYFYDIETGLYYLQSRYYMPEWGRFISADGIAQVNGLNLYRYCYNNPIIFVDSNGKMAVSALQMLFNVYTKGLISSSVTAYCTLALNGRGIYNAFHEMAQIYLGKAISRLGYIVDLEHAVFINGKKIGEADVVANKHFVWEIKPLISDEYADKQLIIYTSGTGLKRGFKVDPIIVDVMSKIKMVILVLPGGAAYYYFYSTKAGRAITNAELYNALKTVMVTACAVAASIIAITIAEDIFTGGVGIMDDGVSLAGAAGSMAPIILVGLRTAGYA